MLPSPHQQPHMSALLYCPAPCASLASCPEHASASGADSLCMADAVGVIGDMPDICWTAMIAGARKAKGSAVLLYRQLQEASSRHQEATVQSSRTADLEAARLRAELDQASAMLRAKDAELAAVQHKLAAAESAAARPAPATPAPAAAPGVLRLRCICLRDPPSIVLPALLRWICYIVSPGIEPFL